MTAADQRVAEALAAATLAFLAFGLTASAVYVLNDLLDLPADRRYPSKCRRPVVAGDLPLLRGAVLIPLLLVAAVLSLFVRPLAFSLVLAGISSCSSRNAVLCSTDIHFERKSSWTSNV